MATALWRGTLTSRVRLVSGLVLFAFAATHFLNHALGLVSLDAMLAGQRLRTAVTGTAPGEIVLLGSLLAHAVLGLRGLVRKRSWTMPPSDWVQLLSGVAIPLLLIPHVVNTRVAYEVFGVRPTYVYELARIWPATIVNQGVLMLLVWVHGCIGLHMWLRLSPRYPRMMPGLYALAVLVPFAALAGVSVQGRAVEAAMAQPDRAAVIREQTAWPDPGASAALATLREQGQWGYAALLALLVALAGVAAALMLRRRRLLVSYVGGPVVRAEPGLTLLEVSRRHGVPHVSVCGGRGRCSTCRVLVMDGGAGMPSPHEAELRTLHAIGAGKHVRLARQVRPTGPVTVLPMVKDHHREPDRAGNEAGDGVEREVAVLFVDLRGFTALTERKLPFDVIFILNQFFAAAGGPIQANGGWIANTAGDGLIALFSDEAGIGAACRAALLAVVGIDNAVEELSQRLLEETHVPLKVAMGLHAGPHVMGRRVRRHPAPVRGGARHQRHEPPGNVCQAAWRAARRVGRRGAAGRPRRARASLGPHRGARPERSPRRAVRAERRRVGASAARLDGGACSADGVLKQGGKPARQAP